MRPIGIPGKRHSDNLMTRFVAQHLGIPEHDDGGSHNVESVTKTASEKQAADCGCDCGANDKCACKCHKTASTHCPQCGGSMAVKGNMERCACGYAQATAASVKTAANVRKASETSVAEYYKKIFPDDYVSEMTGNPDSGKAGEKVEYGNVSINKPVGDVGVQAARVTAREVLAFGGEDGSGGSQAGDCEVPDSKPTPPEQKPNGKGDEAGNAKMMGGDSANSVGDPGDIPAGEKPNGKVKETGDVKVPDLGVPKGAARLRPGFMSRETVAQFCPECAAEMKKAGIKAIKTSFIAQTIAKRANDAKAARK